MSNCIKDFYEYELVEKGSKCGFTSLKSNFYNDRTETDGYRPQCKFCCKMLAL